MFVQIIEGATQDAAGVRRALDRWKAELASGAAGWLGSTAGVADDGTCVIAARFASEADARRNSDRPEQDAWWAELVKHFEAPPVVFDCGTVALWRGGGSDEAAFVQVIAADVVDGAGLRAALADTDILDEPGRRPDVIGGVFAVADDDTCAYNVVYFTSEEEARRGEAEEQPDDPAWDALLATIGEPRFVDLPAPWLYSP